MASDDVLIRAGDTQPIVFILYYRDPQTKQLSRANLSGISALTLRLRDQDGTVKTTSLAGYLSITGSANGEVTLSGHTSSWWSSAAQFYHWHFRAEYSNGDKITFERAREQRIAIIPDF